MGKPPNSQDQFRLRALSVLFSWVIAGSAAADDVGDQEVRLGQFEVTYTPAQLLDATTVAGMSDLIDADEEITWKMYVPETYDTSEPAGLMVYVSPTADGSMPRTWRSVIDEENIIWIAANDSGNRVGSARRILYTILGPRIATKLYEIDTDRIYLSGFSGGGKVASIVAIEFATLFDGAMYIGGAEPWADHPPRMFDQVMNNRYVFVTGDADFNQELTQRIYLRYKDAGLQNIKLMTISGMGHTTPDRRNFRKAFSYLDEHDQE